MSNALRDQLQAHFGDEYLLDREMKSGGMSRVFVGLESSLQRRVVVKVLAPERVAFLSSERFRREVSLTAKLQHPHIVPILATGMVDGIPYYVMPFIDGESLRARLSRDGRMSINGAKSVLVDIAEALDYAHAHGVVHRDIKPDNILMAGRSALVTDFGVAKAVESSSIDGTAESLTTRGTALGTPAYMAPEQVAADPAIDHRVDIYALGVVAYELLTGATPFGSRSPAGLLSAQVVEEPRPIDAIRSELPPIFADLVMRCLAKEPARRPADAAAVLTVLDRVPHVTGTQTAYKSTTAPDDAYSSIGVLPFENLSGDGEGDFLSEGITEAILNALARLPTVRVAARTSSFTFKGSELEVREIGRRLRVSTLLWGSVRKSGQRVRVRAELVNVEDGFQLWSGRFDREWKDIFEIEDEISAAIADALARALSAPRTEPVTRAGRHPPRDVIAYELYLKGRYFLDQRIEGMWKAMTYYDRALERDPAFALGHAGVAEAHFLLTLYAGVVPRDGAPKAREAAARALALDPHVPDAHTVLANVSLWYDWNREQARQELDQAIALKPSDSLAHSCYAYYYASLGRTDDAIACAQRALAIDPLSLWVHSNLAVTYYLARRYAESIERCRAIIELAPSYSEAYRWMALSQCRLRDWTGGLSMLEKAVELSGRNHWPLANLGALFARGGRRDEAQSILSELMDRSEREPVPPLAIATVHYGLGDLDSVFAWLDKAYDARDFWLIMLAEDPGFTDLRQDPRFGSVLARIVSGRRISQPADLPSMKEMIARTPAVQ